MVFYTFGYLLWYSEAPLGLSPVLDGLENLLIAQSIHQGVLAAEPFYRAPLYPALLSFFYNFAEEPMVVAVYARFFNGCLHLITSVFILVIALKIWKQWSAAFFSVVLYGFNPVVLHFVADPLDITLGITLLIASIYCLQIVFIGEYGRRKMF